MLTEAAISTATAAIGGEIAKSVLDRAEEAIEKISQNAAIRFSNIGQDLIAQLQVSVEELWKHGSETQNMLKYFSGIERDIPVEDIKIQKKIIDTIMARIVGESEEDLTNNINLVKDYIDSDLSLEELLKLFSTFSKIETSKNMVYTLVVSSTELEGEGIVYLPDVANLSNLFNKDQVQECTP